MDLKIEDIVAVKGKLIQEEKKLIVVLNPKNSIVPKNYGEPLSEENSETALVSQVITIDKNHKFFEYLVEEFNINSFEE
jgi:hypothetical protein